MTWKFTSRANSIIDCRRRTPSSSTAAIVMPRSARGTTRATSPANKSSHLKRYCKPVLMIALHFPFLQPVHSRVFHFRRVLEHEYDMKKKELACNCHSSAHAKR